MRFTWSLALADLALAGTVLYLGSVFWLDRPPATAGLAWALALILSCHLLSRSYSHPPSAGLPAWTHRMLAGNLLAIAAYAALRGFFPHQMMSRMMYGDILVVFAAFQLISALVCRRTVRAGTSAGQEALRWALLAALAVAVHQPLLTTGSIGSGDSYWYTIMVSDFVSQWRAGVFPVFVGQSEFAFNGAVSPLRLAAGLQHLAGVVDLATIHSLPYRGILNLSLLLSYVGGAFMCYGCLRVMEPRMAWLAWVFSLLYSTCPALLAQAYLGDLYMSVTTVPFLPLACLGVWLTVTRGNLEAVLIMVGATAALWYCHPPIAMWTTLAIASTQLVRLSAEGAKWTTWRNWTIGAAVFAVMIFYCVVSVKTLGLSAPHLSPLIGYKNMAEYFWSSLRSVSNAANALSDYQLGWALLGTLLAGAVGLVLIRPRRNALPYAAAILLLLVFVVPTPWLHRQAWLVLPQIIIDATYSWPMQRFYVVLASFVVFFTFAVVAPLVARRWKWARLLLFLSFIGAGWSAHEAWKFQRHTALTRISPAEMRRQLLPQNIILTRYAFSVFPAFPPYFSHGFIDPQQQNRLLAPKTFAEISSNRSALEAAPSQGRFHEEGVLIATQPDPNRPALAIEPVFRLEPHRRYALTFEFAHPEFVGSLQLLGTTTSRYYWLPDSGFGVPFAGTSRSFGAQPGLVPTLTLWTMEEKPEDLSLQFFFTAGVPAQKVTVFGRYRFKEFDPSQLPIVVEQWVPYRAHLKSATAAYLETPRMFLDGYQARVNGREVTVSSSPDTLAMVPVPAGESVVELTYRGPPLLRFAYFLSLAGWVAWLIWIGLWAWRTPTISSVQASIHRRARNN